MPPPPPEESLTFNGPDSCPAGSGSGAFAGGRLACSGNFPSDHPRAKKFIKLKGMIEPICVLPAQRSSRRESTGAG
jgi:hypothetical protein